MADVFFIIGCARSGTSAWARMLNAASNAEVFIEQDPKLLIESRQLMEGKLTDPVKVLLSAKNEPIQFVLDHKKKYGDKNLSYMPFIPYLSESWDCKIIFLTRDGRDVVRSLMNWHALKAHNIYTSQEDGERDDPIRPEDDPWDYGRLRPMPGDPVFDQWTQMCRFEKCAWYWSAFNRIGLEKLDGVDSSRKMILNVTHADVGMVQSVFEFIGLEGFDENVITEMLQSRINSVPDRTGQADVFPSWPEWSAEQTRMFDDQSADMMSELGYH